LIKLNKGAFEEVIVSIKVIQNNVGNNWSNENLKGNSCKYCSGNWTWKQWMETYLT
jgi:hypothetical protein